MGRRREGWEAEEEDEDLKGFRCGEASRSTSCWGRGEKVPPGEEEEEEEEPLDWLISHRARCCIDERRHDDRGRRGEREREEFDYDNEVDEDERR